MRKNNNGNTTPLSKSNGMSGSPPWSNGGGDLVSKLHALEIRLTKVEERLGRVPVDLGERFARVEEKLNQMATKAWIVGGVVAGIVASVMIVLAILKVFVE